MTAEREGYVTAERCGAEVDALPRCGHGGTTHSCVREAGHERHAPIARHMCGCGSTWAPPPRRVRQMVLDSGSSGWALPTNNPSPEVER